MTAWYSRYWRAWTQRVETLAWAGIVLAGLVFLIWMAAPYHASRLRFSIPGGMRPWAGGIWLLAGLWSGYRARRAIAIWLQGHWLAWCLSTGQKRCETLVRGIWRMQVGIGKVITLGLVLSLWIDIRAYDVLVLAELFSGGFMLAFAIASCTQIPVLWRPFHTQALARMLPSVVFVQMEKPQWAMACCLLIWLAVSAFAVCAVQFGSSGILIFPALIAGGGFIFLQSLMTPGAAALHGLLAWTGISIYRVIGQLMLLPVGIAGVLISPIILAALLLDNGSWMVAGMVGVLLAAYATFVSIVHAPVALKYDRGSAYVFVLLNLGVPVLAWWLLEPFAIPVVCMHLGWLLRRANILWRNT